MPIEVQREQDLDERLEKLGVEPSGEVILLPRNVESRPSEDLVLESTAPTVEKILREEGLSVSRAVEGQRVRKGGGEWVGPAILIPASVYAENPQIASIITGVIANYLTDFLKGAIGATTVKLDFYVEKKDEHTHISYEGPCEGLSELRKMIEEATNGDEN